LIHKSIKAFGGKGGDELFSTPSNHTKTQRVVTERVSWTATSFPFLLVCRFGC